MNFHPLGKDDSYLPDIDFAADVPRGGAMLPAAVPAGASSAAASSAAVSPAPASPAPASPATAQDFTDAVLAALIEMAALSPRRQADVGVAMRRTGLVAPPDAVAQALDQLRSDGSVERPLQLSDGGILVSVTKRGIEHLATTAHRHVVAGLIARVAG
jgi:hypothetical protein